jgi:ABC-type tungstate transport system substrate-binding protein
VTKFVYNEKVLVTFKASAKLSYVLAINSTNGIEDFEIFTSTIGAFNHLLVLLLIFVLLTRRTPIKPFKVATRKIIFLCLVVVTTVYPITVTHFFFPPLVSIIYHTL